MINAPRCSVSRRALLTPLIAACVGRLAPLPAVAVEEESPLVRKLLRQTEENRELNAWRVRVQTEQNAYQAISGEPGVKQLVTLPDGRNAFYDTAQIAAMTREGRLLCPTGLPCREPCSAPLYTRPTRSATQLPPRPGRSGVCATWQVLWSASSRSTSSCRSPRRCSVRRTAAAANSAICCRLLTPWEGDEPECSKP